MAWYFCGFILEIFVAVVMERKHFLFIAFIRYCQKKAVKQTKALETGTLGFAEHATYCRRLINKTRATYKLPIAPR
jgi:hypothetical protein